MKRLVVIIIGAAILGKIFAYEVVRLAENSQETSRGLGQHLVIDRDSQQLNMKNITTDMHIVKRMPPRVFSDSVLSQIPQLKTAMNKKETPAAKTAEKTKEDEKKAKERRKERQKNLEAKAAQGAKNNVAQAPAPVTQVPQVPTAPDYNTSYVALPIGAGANGTAAGQNPTSDTTTAPIIPNRVSTLSTNSAAIAGWIKLLTTSPSAAAMTSFEALFVTKKTITQAEYYQVLNAMVASSNVEARSYAVQGADYYKNISSFKILADESKTETDATVKALANTAVGKYDSATYTQILNIALATGDTYEKAIAESFLGTASTTTPVTPVAPPQFHL